MAKFFSGENWVWKPFGYVADVLLMSCLGVICALPVVTLGSVLCGLYDCAARCVRGTDPAIFSRFFRTGKREFLPALGSTLLWGCILGGCYGLVRLVTGGMALTDTSVVLTAAMLLLLTMAVGVGCWVLPLLSRFTLPFFRLQGTAVRLALSHPVRTLLLGASAVLGVWLCLRFWLPLFVVPMLVALFWSFLLEPVFIPFMEEQAE